MTVKRGMFLKDRSAGRGVPAWEDVMQADC